MEKAGITSACKSFLDKLGIKDSLPNTTSIILGGNFNSTLDP